MQFSKNGKHRKRCKVLHRSRQPTPPCQEEPTSFPEYVAQQPNHVQRLLRECDLSENATLKLVSLIHSTRTFVCGTDGGLLNGLGTFGYVWSDPNLYDELLPIGMGHIPCASLIMSSTRTEIYGLFAALTHLRLVVEYCHIVPSEKASCRIYCDSRAALARVVDKYYEDFGTTWRWRQHFAFEVTIRTCLLQLPISIEWKWVRGHASSRKKEQDFTVPEVLNEAADDLATPARQSPIRTPQDNDHWSEQTVSIIGPHGRMCGCLASELRYCCTAGDLRSYWCSRFRWLSSQVALLDPIGKQKALSKLSPDAKRRIQKLRCGWLPVNRRVSREDPDRQNGYKSCSPGNLVEETVDHILQCLHQLRRDAMHDRSAGMSKTFRSWKTSHLVIDVLWAGALA
jgi:ribonuclease HI